MDKGGKRGTPAPHGAISLLKETNSALQNPLAGLLEPLRSWEKDRVKGKGRKVGERKVRKHRF